MTDRPIIIEGPTSVTIATPAAVVADDREVAWAGAREAVQTRPDIGWLTGRYLGTDVANENGHIFRLTDIETAHRRIQHTPLNMLHRATHVVGTFVATELVTDPVGAADRSPSAHVEALAGVWRYVFPDEWATIAKANAEGTLFYSMEAIPKTVTCPTCATACTYAGPASDTYCEHMAKTTGHKILDDPLFVGGAIVVPPARPGWRHADITELAAVGDQADRIVEELLGQDTDMGEPVADTLMRHLLAGAFRDIPTGAVERLGAHLMDRDFSSETRQKMAKSGVAMPDGSFPIPDKDALRRAIAAYGRASNKAAVKRHIIKRARALGATDMLPADWQS